MDNSHVSTTNIVDSTEFETQASSESSPKSFQFPITNSLLRRHQPLRLQASSPPRYDDSSYKECLKNHAASIGGLALDGCGGYIACPSSDPSNPLSFKCAVCGCHRNFHRSQSTPVPEFGFLRDYHLHHALPPPPPTQGNTLSPNSASPPSFFPSFYPPPPYIVRTLNNISNANNGQLKFQAGCSRINKRFRTKFSNEQKLKMQEVAEKLGWKMQKTEEEMIEKFCNEIGVQRSVFKIWMHNNKKTLRKRDVAGNGDDCSNEDTAGLHFEGNDDITSQNENVAHVSSSSFSENKTI